MGMCKGCGEVFSALEMESGYCKSCLTDEIKEQASQKEFKIVQGLKENKSLADILFSFEGRVPRSIFWFHLIGSLVVSFFIYMLVLGNIRDSIEEDVSILTAVFFYYYWLIPFDLVLLWTSIAIMIKRLHDLNKSGWYVLVFYVGIFIPLINIIIAIMGLIGFIYLGFIRGTVGQNQYGNDPSGIYITNNEGIVKNKTQNEINQNIKYCHKCGTKSDVNVNFCQNCGAKINFEDITKNTSDDV